MQEKGASVPPGPVIPRVENADLKSMPIIDSHIPLVSLSGAIFSKHRLANDVIKILTY